MKPVIEVENLRKSYGATVAVEDVTFCVQAGEIFGLVGPNGAGKTTTIECLEGLRRPDRGGLSVLGLDPGRQEKQLRPRLGVQLQQANLPERIKVWEALDLYASFYSSPLDWRGLLDQLGLAEKRDAVFAKLSGGQKQRLFIALALINDPELVFLDELTTGLDPQARRASWDLVRAVRARGKTVFLTTHFMEEAERLCDRVAIMDKGRIVALDTPASLVRRLGTGERVSFRVEGGLHAQALAALERVGRVQADGDGVVVHGRAPVDDGGSPLVAVVVAVLAAQGTRFHDLRSEQANLEDVFLALTGRRIRD